MAVNPSIIDDSLRQIIENTLNPVLNLGEPRLKDKRKQAWRKFDETLIEQEEFQAVFPDSEALYAYLQDYLAIQLQIKAPFCFINYHFIKNLMGNLL